MLENNFKLKLLALYPDFDRATGPYQRKDKRFHVVLNNSSLPKNAPNKLRTLSWPKAIMEVELNRILSNDETVDHIDENVENNEIENLQILTRCANIQKSQQNGIWFECLTCDKQVYRPPSRTKEHVFCSYTCRAIGLSKIYKADVAQLVGGN